MNIGEHIQEIIFQVLLQTITSRRTSTFTCGADDYALSIQTKKQKKPSKKLIVLPIHFPWRWRGGVLYPL